MQHLGWLLIAIIFGTFQAIDMSEKPDKYPIAAKDGIPISIIRCIIVIFVLGEMIYWGFNLMFNY